MIVSFCRGELGRRVRRTHPAPPREGRKALLSALSELKRKRRERWLANGKSEIPEWAFCGRDASFLQINNVKNRHFFRRPLVELTRLRHAQFRAELAGSETLGRPGANVVSAGV